MHELDENFKSVQAENYSLREYIIHLQSRLIESQGEFPQPPPNVNLNHPHGPSRGHGGSPVAAMAGMNAINANTARNIAAASLNSNAKHGHEEPHNYDHKRFKETATTEAADEEIIRAQLQASSDGLPAPSMQTAMTS
jgi:hypothetical protein